jgi:bacterial/archaeal transporter family protein
LAAQRPRLLKASWFWYSILCLLCFAAYVFASKLGLKQGVPDSTMFYLFIWGSLPVALVLLAVKGFQVEKSPKGILCGILVGILGGAGQMAMLRALAVPGGNTSVISTITGLYPMVTVVLAVLLLRERVTAVQSLGLVLSATAIVIFARTPETPLLLSWASPNEIQDWLRPAAVVLGSWGAVGIFQKLATNHISAGSTLIWQTLGFSLFLPFVYPLESLSAFVALGVAYGFLGGTLTNLGSWFLFAALRNGGKVSIVAPLTALYPLIVVFLAPFILYESISLLQGVGVVCALVAIVLLSA